MMRKIHHAFRRNCPPSYLTVEQYATKYGYTQPGAAYLHRTCQVPSQTIGRYVYMLDTQLVTKEVTACSQAM